ncbi:MAG: cytidylate kinase-like family protein [Bacteroidota bacterium]
MEPTFLSKYLNVRFTGEIAEPDPEHKGMVITISRDTGCNGMPIVKEVIKVLNANLKGINKKHPWKYVSKEIFEKSAKKLNVNPDIFDKLENSRDKSFVEEILRSFSTERYPSEFKIKKTFKEVIRSVEKGGGVVILGRAGIAIVKHNRRNLHVKLSAPIEWRVNKVAREYKISETRAHKHVIESDQKRNNFKRYYMRRKVAYTDYDLVLNVSTLTKKEICSAIVSMIKEKSNL